MKTTKIKLSSLKVKSFVTSMKPHDSGANRATTSGAVSGEDSCIGTTIECGCFHPGEIKN